MNKIKKLILVIGLIVALLIAQVIMVKNVSQYEPKINIVYAKEDIHAKDIITKDMLTTKAINISMVHLKSYKDINDLIGKTAKADIASGEMILNTRIGKVDEMSEIKMLDKNNRLFSIEFKPDQANAWWVLVDQRVDLIFVPTTVNGVAQPITSAAPETELSAKNGIISLPNGVKRLNDIRIAAIIDETAKQLSNDSRTNIPKYISFEVTPEQDIFLAWAKGNGRIEMSVRPSK